MPRQFFPSMTSNMVQILTCVLGGGLCLIPLFTTPMTDFGDSPLRIALTSQRFRDPAVAAVALTLPIFLDIVTEALAFVFIGNKARKIKMILKGPLLNTGERLLLALGILIIPITAFLPPDMPNLVNLYFCLRRSRTLLVSGAVVISLCRFDSNFWTVKKTNAVIILLVIGTFFHAFADNSSQANAAFVAHYVASGSYTVITGIIFSCNILWLYSVCPMLFRRLSYFFTDNRYETLRNDEAYTHLLFPLLYSTATTATATILALTSKTFRGSERLNVDNHLFHIIAFLIYLLFIVYLSERMMKYEVVQGLYALIESKKMYVRYISHELRTPLNSAFLGLKLVCDDLDNNTAHSASENYETLLDVQSACGIAVEILNDLLCFDKLESGILELHKHEVPVIPFIADCVNMFASQAREAGVTITNSTTLPPGMDRSLPPLLPPPLDAYPHDVKTRDDSHGRLSASSCRVRAHTVSSEAELLDDDTVFMDKFKMDQVLRNLISNALKFTPRGGSVTVCAVFIPSSGDKGHSPLIVEADNESYCSNSPGLFPNWFPSMRNMRRGSEKNLLSSSSVDIEMGDVGPLRDGVDGVTHDSCFSLGGLKRSNYVKQKSEEVPDSFMDSEETKCGGTGTGVGTGMSSVSLWNAMNASISGSSETSSISLGKLRIIVTDTGVGISKENQLKLFKEIIQFHPEVLQAGGGSGLGLWITSSIVQMHSGTISAYSAGQGKGSTFTVEIDMQRRPQFDPPNRGAELRPLERLYGVETRGCYKDGDLTHSPKGMSELEVDRSADLSSDCSPASLDGATEHLGVPVLNPLSVYIPVPLPLSFNPILDVPTINDEQLINNVEVSPASRDEGADRCTNTCEVLIVDDSSLNRKMLRKVLSNANYICEEADDGLSAVAKVKARIVLLSGGKREYDAILMDFVMPNMDGPTATKVIRGLGYEGPIFGVTGNTLDGDVKHFISSGANLVLAKPFDFNLFKDMLKKARTV